MIAVSTHDLLALMWLPFLMCLVLTGIHAYLGFHVLSREVIFVDIALAQIAALGATGAFLVGFELDTWAAHAAPPGRRPGRVRRVPRGLRAGRLGVVRGGPGLHDPRGAGAGPHAQPHPPR